MRHPAFRWAAATALMFFSSAPVASAQFFNCPGATCHTVSGAVSDSTTGPFLAGHVYLVSGSLNVPVGQTLTVGDGAVVKFSGNLAFVVSGTLIANGLPGSPIIFTSIQDDVVADHNGDGSASVLAAAQWSRIFFTGSHASVLNYVEVRGAGTSLSAAFDLSTSNLSMTGCSTSFVGGPCITLSNNSFPTVVGCAFNGGTKAATSIPIGAMAGFSGCTSSGNSVFSAPEITVGGVSTVVGLTLDDSFNGNGAFVFSASINVTTLGQLTLGAGVIVRYTGNLVVTVDGVLNAIGTALQPVVFTSIHDDVHGGDVNVNGGASVGAAAQWSRLNFGTASDASTLVHVLIRCAGTSASAAIDLNASDISLANVTTELCGGPCMTLGGNSFPTASNCAFNGGTRAVVSASIQAVPGFSNCTAAGNSLSNSIDVTSAVVAAPLSLSPTNTMNGDGVLSVSASPTLQSTGTLSLAAGMIFKFVGNLAFTVGGPLICNGTSGSPVVFTSIHDDVHGGDSNLNGGATVGAAAQWSRLNFSATGSASVLTHAIVRCAGTSASPAFDLNAANITLVSCSTDLVGAACIDLGGASMPTATGCAFNGGSRAAASVPIHAVAGFNSCTASGNSVHDLLEVSSATVSSPLVLSKVNTFNGVGVILCSAGPSVLLGASLTLNEGMTMKMAGNLAWIVNGALTCVGTAPEPVVFTSQHDDAYGGDTNKNGGATVGGAGQWSRIVCSGVGTLDLAFTRIRFAGSSLSSALDLNPGSTATLADCVVEQCGGGGMDLNGTALPTVLRTSFVQCSRPLMSANIASVAGFRFCTASACTLSNSFDLTGVSLTAGQVATVERINSFNGDGVFVHAGAVTAVSGSTLRVGRGVIFKASGAGGKLFAQNGATMHLLGTGHDPIVMTSIHDDSFGGDSNLNGGATAPFPGSFSGIQYDAGSSGLAEYVRLRYAGWSLTPGFLCASSGVVVRSVRAERCGAEGLRLLDSASPCDNIVAFMNNGDGVRYGAPVSLRHLTSAHNLGFGVRGHVALPGTIINSIVKFNTAGAFTSVPSTQVSFTCGLVGGGPSNFDADPSFKDGPNGDLGLTVASPCVDTAEVVTSFGIVKDHVEASRLADGKLVGTPFSDLGAYELAPYRLVVTGQSWSDTIVTFEVIGDAPGVAIIALGNLGGTELLIPFGFSLADPIALLLPFVFLPTNTPFVFAIPDVSASAGVVFGMQALATTLANPSFGSFTNLYRSVLDG